MATGQCPAIAKLILQIQVNLMKALFESIPCIFKWLDFTKSKSFPSYDLQGLYIWILQFNAYVHIGPQQDLSKLTEDSEILTINWKDANLIARHCHLFNFKEESLAKYHSICICEENIKEIYWKISRKYFWEHFWPCTIIFAFVRKISRLLFGFQGSTQLWRRGHPLGIRITCSPLFVLTLVTFRQSCLERECPQNMVLWPYFSEGLHSDTPLPYLLFGHLISKNEIRVGVKKNYPFSSLLLLRGGSAEM